MATQAGPSDDKGDGATAQWQQVAQAMQRLTACASLPEFCAYLLEALAFHTAAAWGTVHLQEGNRLRLVARHGAGAAAPPEHLHDGPPGIPPTVPGEDAPGEGTVATLSVPLCGAQEERAMGLISLHRQAHMPFGPRERAIAGLLATFAFERLCTLHVNQALAERERQYHLLEENIRDVLWICDVTGRITYVSPSVSSVAGVRPANLLGCHVMDTLGREDRAPLLRVAVQLQRSLRAAALGDRAQHTIEVPYTRPDGAQIWLETRVGPLRDDAGSPCGIVGVSRDITARKHLEQENRRRAQQLMQADKLVSLGTLVSGIAHEINNPNHLILTSASLLESAWASATPLLEARCADPAFAGLNDDLVVDLQDVPQLLKHLVSGSERIQRVVTDLRDFARGDTAKLDQRVDLNAVVEQSVRIMGSGIHKNAQEFRMELAAGLPAIRGNFIRLEQLLIHLLQNASQALLGTRGRIGVSTGYETSEEQVVVEVWDNGPGISEAHLLQVYDPFFTTKRDLGCIGLGLSVCTAIVRQHHGRISVENRAGGGVLARVTIPVWAPEGV